MLDSVNSGASLPALSLLHSPPAPGPAQRRQRWTRTNTRWTRTRRTRTHTHGRCRSRRQSPPRAHRCAPRRALALGLNPTTQTLNREPETRNRQAPRGAIALAPPPKPPPTAVRVMRVMRVPRMGMLARIGYAYACAPTSVNVFARVSALLLAPLPLRCAQPGAAPRVRHADAWTCVCRNGKIVRKRRVPKALLYLLFLLYRPRGTRIEAMHVAGKMMMMMKCLAQVRSMCSVSMVIG